MLSRRFFRDILDNILSRAIPRFDLTANLTREQDFYDLPYPLDLRLNANKQPDLSGFPIWNTNPVIRNLRRIAQDRIGFPTVSAAYFRFNRPLAEQDPNAIIPAQQQSPILLVDLDPSSPQRGTLYPTIASNLRPDLNYVPGFLLAVVGPALGIILYPNRQYAYIVQRSLPDILGRSVGVSQTVQRLLSDRTPSNPIENPAYQLYQPLWETLSQLGLTRDTLAIATVFTTEPPVEDTARLSQQVRDRYQPIIENVQLDPTDGDTHERFWELQATWQLPQFQTGQAPFFSEGLFEFDPDGQLIEQRQERIPIVITIPKNQPMPADGFPLMIYTHGSNGLSSQGVDRGPILEPGGTEVAGRGPAHQPRAIADPTARRLPQLR